MTFIGDEISAGTQCFERPTFTLLAVDCIPLGAMGRLGYEQIYAPMLPTGPSSNFPGPQFPVLKKQTNWAVGP